jgi:hypothetical protein
MNSQKMKIGKAFHEITAWLVRGKEIVQTNLIYLGDIVRI